MDNRRTWLVAGAAAALCGCAALRAMNRPVPFQDPGIRFFSDLGPDSIDVSTYPEAQRRDYRVYARACSQCHSLARSINSPMASPEFWDMYIMAMRRRSAYAAVPEISMEDSKAILQFLAYDSQVRKILRRAEFDAQTAELRKRFELLSTPRE